MAFNEREKNFFAREKDRKESVKEGLEQIFDILQAINNRSNNVTTKNEISKIYELSSTIDIINLLGAQKISELLMLASTYISLPIVDGKSLYGSESEGLASLGYAFNDVFFEVLGKRIV